MDEKNLIKTVNSLICFATAFLFIGLLAFVSDKHLEYEKDMPCKAENVVCFASEEQRRVIYHNAALEGYYELVNAYVGIEIEYRTCDFYYLGYYFVTAYSHEETGSIMTASDTECHYHEDRLEPTTAAIDRSYHRFGEIIAVDFGDYEKLYVCEDTGSAVKGLHIDCYVPDLQSVYEWGTGYYPTYSVEFVYHTTSGNERMERQELIREYLKEKTL